MMQLESTMGLRVQKGLLLPTIAVSRIMNGKRMIEKLDKDELKSKICVFMSTKEKVTISDIVEKFNMQPEEVIKIIQEMEREGKVRQL